MGEIHCAPAGSTQRARRRFVYGRTPAPSGDTSVSPSRASPGSTGSLNRRKFADEEAARRVQRFSRGRLLRTHYLDGSVNRAFVRPHRSGARRVGRRDSCLEARRRRVPAFRILTDRTMLAVAQARPSSERELLEVHGIGPKLAETYGRALIAQCGDHG
jgi:superfamily II DNA helicase RecQ